MQLSKILSTYISSDEVTVESTSSGAFNHGEADITIISYLLIPVETDTRVIRILPDDTDVCAACVLDVPKKNIQATGQMERWNGSVWEINATCSQLGPKCLQILGMRYSAGSDTTAHMHGKGKVSALKTLIAGGSSWKQDRHFSVLYMLSNRGPI